MHPYQQWKNQKENNSGRAMVYLKYKCPVTRLDLQYSK